MSDQRRVVCAAEQNRDGDVICSPRHRDPVFHKLMTMLSETERHKWERDTVQGFVDQWGRFMTREEALDVAKSKQQIIRRCGGDSLRLYSENLY